MKKKAKNLLIVKSFKADPHLTEYERSASALSTRSQISVRSL